MKYVEIKCNTCGKSDSLRNWYEDYSRLWGLSSCCPSCRALISSKYVDNNPEKIFECNQRRREMSDALPIINLEKDQWITKRSVFNWKCALTRKTNKISMDHFIPVALGHGGTYDENLIPLNKSINSSKNDSNPFLWAKENYMDLDLFSEVVHYLSELNKLTPEEYKSFVFWCFNNKRTVEEVRADPRHSIEIWRETTGIQFPLPAYVYKPRVNDNLNEIGNRSNIRSDDGNGHEINENNAEGGTAS
jgi:hypothetical protein